MTSPSRAAHRAGRRHTRLCAVLAGLKENSGRTFHELAARTTVSASALKRAAGLHTPVAPEHVVTAFVRACGADAGQEQEVLELWRTARAEQRGILATLQAPAMAAIRTGADLTAALAAAYERAGAPALRLLQERATTDDADGALLLPLTSAWRITRREALPATWTQCAAFLRGCGIHPRHVRAWHDAWTRAQTPAQARTPTRRSSQAAARLVWLDPSGQQLRLGGESDWLVALFCEDQPGFPGGQALTRVFGILPPGERHSVLSTGLTRLLASRASRNGTVPGTLAPDEPHIVLLASRARRNGALPDTLFVADGLSPDERHTVLATGINRLATTHTRRNGTAPDTLFVADDLSPDEPRIVLATGINRLLASRARRNGIVPDTLFVADDGTFHLIQPKHYRDTAPPGLAAVLQAQHA
ncbi:hypothetical protein [Streptomyces hokutonensis]|uniref:hypothetical protein n=1 Tax=Streptomyces hokutonensis TaxID=1306990 RepID=UPI003690F930